MSENAREISDRTTISNPYNPFSWTTRVAPNMARRLLSVQNWEGTGLSVGSLVVDISRNDGYDGSAGQVEGTPISATTLNNLEGRIGNAFTILTNYINEDAEVKFADLYSITGGLDEDISDLEENTYASSENINISNITFNGVLKYVNSGIYDFEFFIPYNKHFTDAIHTLITLDGEFTLYADKKLNSTIIDFSDQDLSATYSINDLGVLVTLTLTNLLQHTSTDDVCGVIQMSNNTQLQIIISGGGN